MTNRRTFVTGNQLEKTRFFAIVAGFMVLLVLFCALGNVGTILSVVAGNGSAQAEEQADEILSVDTKTQQAAMDEQIEAIENSGNARIVLYGEGDIADLFAAQLFMSKHPYVRTTSLDNSLLTLENLEIIFVATDTLTESDVSWLSAQSAAGVTIVFGQIPSSITTSETFKKFVGVTYIGSYKTYDGLRMSSEILDGQLVEDPEREVSAWDVTLGQQTKVYANALPEGYEDIENQDLPPLVWRYIQSEETGAVYVCNGDFMQCEIAYALIPLVMRESQGSYLYPVVNAYCTFIDGFPFVDNEEREVWRTLYSRDRLGIQQDMLMPEFERFAQVYGSIITYFSDDYAAFKSASTQTTAYYSREIASQRAQLALRSAGKMYIRSNTDPVLISAWTAPYRLWDEETQSYELPINCVVSHDNYNTLPDLFCLASITGSIGYYGVSIDVDDFMDHVEDSAYWADYTEEIEVLFGTHQRDYSWIERTTANEALARVQKLLNLQVDIEYHENEITADIANFDGSAWFIFRSTHENITAEGATIQQVGDGMYFISASSEYITLRWSDGL